MGEERERDRGTEKERKEKGEEEKAGAASSKEERAESSRIFSFTSNLIPCSQRVHFE